MYVGWTSDASSKFYVYLCLFIINAAAVRHIDLAVVSRCPCNLPTAVEWTKEGCPSHHITSVSRPDSEKAHSLKRNKVFRAQLPQNENGRGGKEEPPYYVGSG